MSKDKENNFFAFLGKVQMFDFVNDVNEIDGLFAVAFSSVAANKILHLFDIAVEISNIIIVLFCVVVVKSQVSIPNVAIRCLLFNIVFQLNVNVNYYFTQHILPRLHLSRGVH
jgi:hypothetical protein